MELQEVYKLKENLEKIIDNLEKKKELFDAEQLYELQNKLADIEMHIQDSQKENRLLRIGIVGSVKAGKSSFLNACIFDGKNILPKAATSTTAALTKIAYSPTPRATVHFYSRADWDIVAQRSNEYSSKLNDEYEKYKTEWENQKKNENTLEANGKKDPFGKHKENINNALWSIEDFEKRSFKQMVSENLAAAHELFVMAEKNQTDFSVLGETVEIEGQMNALQEYVSGNGKFTPIVSDVELRTNEEGLEGLEIIDTPGLNDPIVSRSKVTKKFLSQCNVVILLSPCSQFMDANTITLMSNALPSNNVSSILVVGSKLDYGILNERNGDFGQAYKTSVEKYKQQFRESLRQIQATEYANQVTTAMKEKEPIFISSMCYFIAKKLRNGQTLDEEEQKVLDQLSRRYTGFKTEPDFILGLSGINKMERALKEIGQNKAETIERSSKSFASSVARSSRQILNEIYNGSVENKAKLENGNLDGLQLKYAKISEALDRSRRKLSAVFTNAGLDSAKKAISIKSKVADLIGNYQNIKTETRTHDETGSYKSGFLGLKTTVITTSITDHLAGTSQVKTNIERYVAKSMLVINEDFNYMFNIDQLTAQIKEVVLEAFNSGEGNYSEDDILIPLSTVIKRMQIPSIHISADEYIDTLNSEFPRGSAENEEIHRLSSIQASILSKISKEIAGQLDKCIEKIANLMDTQSTSFADEISQKIDADMKRIISQIEDKEKYIRMYSEFKTLLNQYKEELGIYCE